MNWLNFKDKIKRYFWFSNKELNHLLLLAIIFAFIFSFTEWGTVAFDISAGVKNLLVAFVIAIIALFIHHAVQRVTSLQVGFKPEHKIWWPGVLLGLILVIFSNGKIMLFVGCYFLIHMLEAHRLGRFRYGPNFRTWGYIAMTGPLANLLTAGIIKVINIGIGSPALDKFVLFSFLLAIYNALPFPPLDGSRMFFASRAAYVLLASGLYGYLALIYAFGFSSLSALIYAIPIAAACWIMFFVAYERKVS